VATLRKDFQAFTFKANGTLDRVVTEIKVLPAFDPSSPDPKPAGVRTTALWDTGASKSVISGALASTLGLTPVGTARVNHAGGVSLSPTCLVAFELPHGVAVLGIIASEFQAAPNGFGAIVGWT
jgi:hypothetical protein